MWRKLALGAGGEGGDGVALRPQSTPHDTARRPATAPGIGMPSLEELDPTQRAFADRVLAWAREVIVAYKEVRATGAPQRMPLLRSWLCGSVGSGKSAVLKATVWHVRKCMCTYLVHVMGAAALRVAMIAAAGPSKCNAMLWQSYDGFNVSAS